MLDVHPPEHGIHGVRDFFIHLLTITVGLLIAIGLEAGVEALHHREQREQAAQQLRQELVQNRRTLVAIQKQTDREITGLGNILIFLQDLRAGKKDDPSVLNLDLNSEPLQSAAWRTASATGALSYMDYEEVQRFAAAYQIQQVFEDAVARAFHDYELFATFTSNGQNPGSMQPQDVETAITTIRATLADVKGMSDITRGTLALYDEALKK